MTRPHNGLLVLDFTAGLLLMVNVQQVNNEAYEFNLSEN